MVYLNDYETVPGAAERPGAYFRRFWDTGLRIRSIWMGGMKDEIADDADM